MLLTFSRHQMMYNVSFVVVCAEVTYKGYLSYSKKVKNKIKHSRALTTSRIVSELCFILDSATIISIFFP